jgi:long-chain acyl-CoA synthetase
VANMEQACVWISDLKDEVILAVLPLVHSYGMTACHHVAVRSGAVLILEPRFALKRVINDIKKYKVTIFPGVPTMFSAIHNFATKNALNLSSIRVCISGGAPLSGELKENFEKMTGGKLVEGYGLTEASPIALCNPIRGLNKKGSVGLPWSGTEARIVDLKTGLSLSPYQIGELQIKGPQVMQGYWQKPEETKKIISAEGWLSTGDIAYFDRDGYFYIVDRKKDLIFYGGSNIYPGEVEGILMEHPHILEAAVIGIPDKHYGYVIKAFVVADPGQRITQNDIIRFCEGKLAKYKIPGEIEFRTQLPKNFLGKVIHRKLRE